MEIHDGAQLTLSFSSNMSDRVGTLKPTLSSKTFTSPEMYRQGPDVYNQYTPSQIRVSVMGPLSGSGEERTKLNSQ